MSRFITSFLIILAGIGVLFVIYNNAQTVSKKIDLKKDVSKNQNNPKIVPQKISKKYLFVPYWTFGKNIETDGNYSLIYFGLGVNENGIDISDKGFRQLDSFVALTPNAKERILTIRMVDSTLNAQILKDKVLSHKIAIDSVNYAKEKGFDALMLDFETSAFAFDSTVLSISDFYSEFSKVAHGKGFKFYVTLFGDTYFRTRAYNVKKIGELSDKVFIMTYDFHKSKGNPGPDFPLFDKGEYGYDITKMVIDFQKDIENSKIVIVLGLFGYDWRVDKDQKSDSLGVSLSTNEITKEFITDCKYKNCSLTRLSDSKEPSIVYIDAFSKPHVIWFEDKTSIDKKIEYLKSKGIQEIGFWAYSFF